MTDPIHAGYDSVLDARQAAQDAETWALDRSLDPEPPADHPIPPWSEISDPGEAEGQLPF